MKFKYLNSVLDTPAPALEVLISLFSWAVLFRLILGSMPELLAPPLPILLGWR